MVATVASAGSRPRCAWFFGALLCIGVPAAAVERDAGDSLKATAEVPRDRAGEPIVVTGTATPLALDQLGYSITVIDTAEIQSSHVAYLADLLRAVPGVSINRAGSFGALTQLRIRGGEANHALVLIDGVEVASIGEGAFDLSSLLAENIERVEVLRGPQSGLYGSNALAGVVSVITRGGDGPRLASTLEAGSFGTVSATASATLGKGDTFLAASSQIRSTVGISAAAIGTESDADRNATLHLRGGTRLAPRLRLDGSLRVVDRHTETDGFDFSGGPDQGLAIDDASFSDTSELSAGLSLLAEPATGWSARLSAAYTAERLTGGIDPAASFGDQGRRLKISGQLTHTFATGSDAEHTLTLFADHERESYRNTFPADPGQVPAEHRTITGFGGQYRLALFERLFLAGTLRHDANSRFADATTWSLAGAWRASPATRLHASWGKGVTNPTFYEQFGYDPGSFVGNPDLRPESARGYDIGVEQRVGQVVRVDATWFGSTLRDEIVSLYPSVVNDAGLSRRRGVELTLGARWDAFRLNASYTWLDAHGAEGEREVRRPEHQASLTADADFGGGQRGNLELGLVYNGRMLDTDFRDYFADGYTSKATPLGAYLIARLAASWRLEPGVVLFGRIENLFDTRYQEAISYGAPGLAAYGGLTVRLD